MWWLHLVSESPQPPGACTIRNRTSSAGGPAGAPPEVEVKCIAGADGGLRQHFLLEVYESHDDVDPFHDPGGDGGYDEDKSNEINGLVPRGGGWPRTHGKDLDMDDPSSGSGSGSGAASAHGEMRDAIASRGQVSALDL